ncbi:hypothetical protein NFIA_106170 [Paecilomyces variotii No. 5]|uniref:Pentatricopeptide repeat domain-containing protein n=1 Tax=Byssochlamys spectabilis (strain No. 5 / NBRC 109023) TaxID=1356009 RepID=V5I5Y0_BYSSN|nr:hypothetical protein NFIA_106170 [Paecilomyces variotii No. 5]
MRPALLRLLKRPSAVSILDLLVGAPLGIEQLNWKGQCIRCQARRASRAVAAYKHFPPLAANSEPSPNRAPVEPKSQTKLHIYDIGPSRSARHVFEAEEIQESDPTTARRSSPDWTLVPENLEYESDIGHLDNIGSRLIDQSQFRNDLSLWEELLRYRQRHYGETGTIDVWKGLTVRHTDTSLPVEGEQADFFWQSFIDVALVRDTFLHELVDYAFQLQKRDGARWSRFYESIVGGLLDQGRPKQAVRWHKILQKRQLFHADDLTRILQRDLQSNSRRIIGSSSGARNDGPYHLSTGIRVLQGICRSLEKQRVYGLVIPALATRGRVLDALAMHGFLVKRGDHPRNFEEVQVLIDCTKQLHLSTMSLEFQEYCQARFLPELEAQDQSQQQKEPKDEPAGPLPQDRPIKDEFGARLFATKALTPDVIVGGLQMFGVSAIGPQSLREMALRAHGSQDILEKIKYIQKAGISIGDSVFSRVVRKLASENRDIVLYDVLHSDQHPDTLEDVVTQEALLVSYYMARDWRQYNMTLAVLVELVQEDPDLFNIHFRKHINAGEWNSASRIVDEMFIRKRVLSRESIAFMLQEVLSPRRKGTAPSPRRRLRPIDEIDFVTRLLRRVTETGMSVDPDVWVETLKRLGMKNRWDDLCELAIWLAHQYSPEKKAILASLVTSTAREQHGSNAIAEPALAGDVLRAIFNPKMQMAIVAWGFKLRPSSNTDSKVYNPLGVEGQNLVPWVRGLVLLRDLEREGVPLETGWIRRACRHRLAVLFGPPRYSNRRMNRLLRRENPYDVTRVIGDMLRVWGPSLFFEQERRDLHGLLNPRSSVLSLRRSRHLARRKAYYQRQPHI